MTDKKSFEFLVDEDDVGERLDSFLSAQIPELSRSRIQKALRAGDVLVDGEPAVKSARKVRQGERVALSFSPPRPLEIVPEDIPLDIAYEDEHLLVVNKAPGMVVHPAPGHETGTLVHALMAHCRNLSGIGGVLRPGIVHRLDAGTSGLLVVAKDDETHIALSRALMERAVSRLLLRPRLGGDAGADRRNRHAHRKIPERPEEDGRRGRGGQGSAYDLLCYRHIRTLPVY